LEAWPTVSGVKGSVPSLRVTVVEVPSHFNQTTMRLPALTFVRRTVRDLVLVLDEAEAFFTKVNVAACAAVTGQRKKPRSTRRTWLHT
jgi:hypothetical protein